MKRVLLLFCMVMLIFWLLCGCGRAPADPVAPTPDPNGSQTSESNDSTVSSEVLERLWKSIGFHSSWELTMTTSLCESSFTVSAIISSISTMPKAKVSSVYLFCRFHPG